MAPQLSCQQKNDGGDKKKQRRKKASAIARPPAGAHPTKDALRMLRGSLGSSASSDAASARPSAAHHALSLSSLRQINPMTCS